MARTKLLLRLVLLALALCLLSRPSVARGPKILGGGRALLQGEDPYSPPEPEEAYGPGPSEATYEDNEAELEAAEEAAEEAEEEAQANNPTYEEDNPEPIDDPEGDAVDEAAPEFVDAPPDYQSSQEAQQSTPGGENPMPDGEKKDVGGPSAVVVAFSVIGSLVVVAAVAGGVFFIFKRQKERAGLEFKPLRETELSNDKFEMGDLDDSTKLQRSESNA